MNARTLENMIRVAVVMDPALVGWRLVITPTTISARVMGCLVSLLPRPSSARWGSLVARLLITQGRIEHAK